MSILRLVFSTLTRIRIETEHFLIRKYNSKNSTVSSISENSLTFGPGSPCPGNPLEPGGPFGP